MEKYEIIRNLGRGSYGSVELARLRPSPGSPSNDKEQLYTIKKIKLKHLPPEERKKALDEAAVLRKLNHPKIVAFGLLLDSRMPFFWVLDGLLPRAIDLSLSTFVLITVTLFAFWVDFNVF